MIKNVSSVVYDTDEDDVELPTEFEIDVPDDEDEYQFIEDYISDETGFMVISFVIEEN